MVQKKKKKSKIFKLTRTGLFDNIFEYYMSVTSNSRLAYINGSCQNYPCRLLACCRCEAAKYKLPDPNKSNSNATLSTVRTPSTLKITICACFSITMLCQPPSISAECLPILVATCPPKLNINSPPADK
ncbi:hypothetical protein BpHYR1_039697 [Brachionus plicatilis]|uniref:Uncharacterized protein n=1 Tax=Brachionus plicatilis TaxID=10195 RepID=A0A3M7QC96_BRAPC|nr:hypothetical protein BpHYR1_039697 [Brachionus plicatilis]